MVANVSKIVLLKLYRTTTGCVKTLYLSSQGNGVFLFNRPALAGLMAPTNNKF